MYGAEGGPVSGTHLLADPERRLPKEHPAVRPPHGSRFRDVPERAESRRSRSGFWVGRVARLRRIGTPKGHG